MTVTGLLPASSVVVLVALLAVLGARTVLAERGAGTATRFARSTVVRRLDVAGVVLSVLCAGLLVTTVVVGVLAGV